MINPQDAVAATSELLELLIYDKISNAIIETLVKSRVLDGLHYNQLFRETNITLRNNETSGILTGKQGKSGKSLNWKPFNERLKKLVAMGIVTKIEKSKYSVKYQVPFIKELNNAAMDLTLSMTDKTATLVQVWADELGRSMKNRGPHVKQANKKKRIEGTEHVIRSALYTIVYHTLMCMWLGVTEGQEGKFVRFSSVLTKSYRDIMTTVLLITFYVSGVPETIDCLKTISEEMDKNSGIKWVWPWTKTMLKI